MHHMDAILLARIQFALTSGFHFIFPPLSIGLAWLLVIIMHHYKDSGEKIWESMAKFWIRIFAITFAMGVATGIVLEFQFGTNWSNYSRFVGDIFGAPLAAEGITSFFLESVFVGVLVYGFGKVSKRTLYMSSILVAVGATLSGFWIIVANSWMQTPAGYHMVGGRAELTDFWAAVFNPSTMPRYIHTIIGALITGSFFMMAVSASFLLKQKHEEFARRCFKLALIFAFSSSMLQGLSGHIHAIQVANTQPEKLATFEGLFETQKNAPAIIFGIPDEAGEKIDHAIRVPGLLSLLVSGTTEKEIKGLKDFPRDERPPLALTFTTFHLMVAMGVYFIAVSGLGIALSLFNRLWNTRLLLKLVLVSAPLPFVANELGWISAEVGRQPWAVYRLIRTSDAASPVVSAEHILFSIIAFTLIYIFLFGAWLFLIKRQINKGPEASI